jgi:hypothetical protein
VCGRRFHTHHRKILHIQRHEDVVLAEEDEE